MPFGSFRYTLRTYKDFVFSIVLFSFDLVITKMTETAPAITFSF